MINLMSTKMASHLALEGSITLKVVREGEQSRASCRGPVRGCAPQLPPRPGAAGRFASRPERPASRLPAQPRRFLSLMCRNHGSSIRSVLRRGIGFLENDLSAAARGVVFNESKLIKSVGRPAPAVQSRPYQANSAPRRAAGHTRRPTKVRFIRLWQRPGEILDADRPQGGEHRPRSIMAPGIWGQTNAATRECPEGGLANR